MHNSQVSLQKRKITAPILLLAGELTDKGPKERISRLVPHYLFHYVTSGSGTACLENGTEITVKSGDWFFAYPNQRILYQQNPDDPWLYMWIGFQGDDVETLLARAGIYRDTVTRQGELDPTFIELFREMIDAAEANPLTGDLKATTSLLQLVTHLIETAPATTRQTQRLTREKLESVIDRACIFMGENYPSGIGAAEVALHSGFERSYFSKVFSQYTGTSIKEYLADLRIRKSKELLLSTDLSIAQIAYEVGFIEPKSFSRFFKEQAKQSPAQYRKSNPLPDNDA